MNRKEIKVLLFNKDIYQKPYLDTLTSKELYEFALADDENVSIYDDVDTFQGDFNDGAILNINNMLVYVIDAA